MLCSVIFRPNLSRLTVYIYCAPQLSHFSTSLWIAWLTFSFDADTYTVPILADPVHWRQKEWDSAVWKSRGQRHGSSQKSPVRNPDRKVRETKLRRKASQHVGHISWRNLNCIIHSHPRLEQQYALTVSEPNTLRMYQFEATQSSVDLTRLYYVWRCRL